MLIRNQQKDGFVNSNNTDVTRVRKVSAEEYVIVTYGVGSSEALILGEYSTKEKAIKAMDMLLEEYSRHFYSEGGQLATVRSEVYVQAFGFIPPKVFTMPQDDEVGI